MRSGAVITFKNTVDRARVVRSPSGVPKTLAKDNGSDTFTAESGTYELRRSNGDVLDTLTVTVV
jgi:hypothetical protein